MAEDASGVESGVINVAPGEHNSFGTMTLCIEDGEIGEVTAVTTPPESGVEIVAYSVANEPSDIGGLQGTLKDLGADTTSRAVRQPCPTDKEMSTAQVATLLIEAVAQDDRSGRADHLTVHWEAEGNSGEFDVQWAIMLCAAVDQEDTGFCQKHLESRDG
ncbi:hypothetical protein [Promicromonospora soli]